MKTKQFLSSLLIFLSLTTSLIPSLSYAEEHNQELKTENLDQEISYYQNQISSYQSQIASLNTQKTQASNEVSTASSELAKAQKLKTFGDTEIQRLKGVLATLKTELTPLQTQLDKAISQKTQYQKDLTLLNTDFAKVAYAEAGLTTSQLNTLNNTISTNQTLANTLQVEITAQVNEINNEASFEKSLSDNTEVQGTQEVRKDITGTITQAMGTTKGNAIYVGGASYQVIDSSLFNVFTGITSWIGYDINNVPSVKFQEGRSTGNNTAMAMGLLAIASGTGTATSGTATAVSFTGVCVATAVGSAGVLAVPELVPCTVTIAGSTVAAAAGTAVATYGGATYKLSLSNNQKIGEAIKTASATKNISLASKVNSKITTTIDAWIESWSKRGFILDDIGGNNVGSTTKGIDIFENQTVTSIKSLDMNAATYETEAGLFSKMKGYIDSMVKYTGGYVKINGNKTFIELNKQFLKRGVKMIFPETMISQNQLNALTRAADYAKSVGIEFDTVVTTVK